MFVNLYMWFINLIFGKYISQISSLETKLTDANSKIETLESDVRNKVTHIKLFNTALNNMKNKNAVLVKRLDASELAGSVLVSKLKGDQPHA